MLYKCTVSSWCLGHFLGRIRPFDACSRTFYMAVGMRRMCTPGCGPASGAKWPQEGSQPGDIQAQQTCVSVMDTAAACTTRLHAGIRLIPVLHVVLEY
jgi:hypothetical protein